MAKQEVIKSHRESISKYSYFLLAAAGAAIGFALNQTQGEDLAWSQLPLGVAVFLWGNSFFFGCRKLQCIQEALFYNAQILRIESGSHPVTGNDPGLVKEASEMARQDFDDKSKSIGLYGDWQFGALIAGAVFYVIWHVVEMYLRTQ